MKLTTKILVLLVLVGCNSKPAEKIAAASDQSATATASAAAPAFNLPSTTGSKINLSDFNGKVVLLDFWATWCPPCRMSTPALVQLNKKYQGKNFAIIGISLDDNKEPVIPFIKKEKVEHLVLYGMGSTIERDYKIRAIPTFFLLDKAGKIVKDYAGFYPELAQEWEKDINLLLAKN